MKRTDLLDFLEENEGATHHEVSERFPFVERETIRMHIYRLRADGHVIDTVYHGKNQCSWHLVCRKPKPITSLMDKIQVILATGDQGRPTEIARIAECNTRQVSQMVHHLRKRRGMVINYDGLFYQSEVQNDG